MRRLTPITALVRHAIVVAAVSFATSCFGTAAFAADPELVKDPPGVKIGEKAPAFELTDQFGKKRSLEAFLKDGHTAIVFYRSASW